MSLRVEGFVGGLNLSVHVVGGLFIAREVVIEHLHRSSVAKLVADLCGVNPEGEVIWQITPDLSDVKAGFFSCFRKNRVKLIAVGFDASVP